MKMFCLGFIRKVSDDMYSSSYDYKKWFAKNVAWSIPTGMPIACFIVSFPAFSGLRQSLATESS